ncbi:MAG TPA: DnaJ domain-containing protein [Kofleriaceae bacterium]|nr:DnaJ domain-containing protein [Kofleriaceae bacterium]
MATGALSIKLRCASWQQLATIYKRDLSRGAMFLKASHPPAIGTTVRIDLTLPSASVIVLTGVVQSHVDDGVRGQGVELKLAPIPAGSIWMIESALSSEHRRQPTPATGTPTVLPPTKSGPVAAMSDGEDMAAAESELMRALVAEAESLRKLNPFLVLGVGYEASDADVRSAFGDLTKRYHPDRFARYESTELRALAAEIFILIRDAYRKIGDSAGRQQVLQAIGRSPSARGMPSPKPVPAAKIPPPRLAEQSAGMRAMATTPAAIPVVTRPPAPPPAPPPATTSQSMPKIDGHSVASPIHDAAAIEELLDDGRIDDALAAYRALAKKQPQDRTLRAGIELCEGLRALGNRDRLEAAQRFESALEIDPSNERAARELADMRRQATNERKGLLSRLMGKKEL